MKFYFRARVRARARARFNFLKIMRSNEGHPKWLEYQVNCEYIGHGHGHENLPYPLSSLSFLINGSNGMTAHFDA